MKVVLFCGGYGMRLREYSESIPKPMVNIGHRPILWQVMKYYAHFGHKDFILCLGWGGSKIKDYFLTYNECMSNDFVLQSGGSKIDLLSSDIHDWSITFVDTGRNACIGERLRAVESHLAGEEAFLANYTDGLSDVPLPSTIDFFKASGSVATFVAIRPRYSFHSVTADGAGQVRALRAIQDSDVWINGGFFVLSTEIFEHLRAGEELVDEPFRRLIALGKLSTFKHDGFWSCMDTYKEKQTLDDMVAGGHAPWEVWKQSSRKAS